MSYQKPSVPGYVDKTGPVIDSAEMNWLDQKAREVVSVLDFGAVGDGTTDDTAAIQAAATFASSSGKSVYFPTPSAFYKITSAINADGSSHWFGESDVATIIRNTSGSGQVINCDGTGSLGPYVFEHLRIGGTGSVVGITVTGGGYANYVAHLTLRHVNFEADLQTGIDANLIYFAAKTCSFGYFQQVAPHVNGRHIISSYGGTNYTNLNTVEQCRFTRSNDDYSVYLNAGVLWRFVDCDWSINKRNLYALNVSGLVLENCYTEQVTGLVFHGAFEFVSSRVPTRIIGGMFEGSTLMAGTAMFAVSSDSPILIEDVDVVTSGSSYTYYNTTTVSHTPPQSGVHTLRNNRISGNASDPVAWMDGYIQGTPTAFTPIQNGLNIVNGTGGATLSGEYSIVGRQVFFTIKIAVTGTCTVGNPTPSASTFIYPFLPASLLPASDSVFYLVDNSAGATQSIGSGYIYAANGRMFLPGWTDRNTSIVMAGTFFY